MTSMLERTVQKPLRLNLELKLEYLKICEITDNKIICKVGNSKLHINQQHNNAYENIESIITKYRKKLK